MPLSLSPEAPVSDPALGLLRVLRDDGRADPATDPFLSTEALVACHREMLRARVLDRALVALQRQGAIGFHASSEGQEAVPVATAFAVEPTDWVFPALRESAVLLVRGFPLERLLAQSFGTAGDVSKGRQMPGHHSSRSLHVVSRSGAVGASLPQAVGAGLAARKTGSRAAVVSFLGDGATSTPDFHAALNFAGVFRAPCIFVCQNNQWAISTPASRQTASATFAVKGRGYGVPGVRVDGNDLLAVYRAVADARVRAVAGGGPTLIECVTFRMGEDASDGEGASGADREAFRAEWAAKDPIERFRKHLLYLGAIDAASDAEIERAVKEEVELAVAAARTQPLPDRATLFEDVYEDLPWSLAEQAVPPVL